MREGGLRALSRGAYDHPRIHRALRRDLQEAGDDPPICRDDYAGTFGGWAHESGRQGLQLDLEALAFGVRRVCSVERATLRKGISYPRLGDHGRWRILAAHLTLEEFPRARP